VVGLDPDPKALTCAKGKAEAEASRSSSIAASRLQVRNVRFSPK
jgi:hypothetical protein